MALASMIACAFGHQVVCESLLQATMTDLY